MENRQLFFHVMEELRECVATRDENRLLTVGRLLRLLLLDPSALMDAIVGGQPVTITDFDAGFKTKFEIRDCEPDSGPRIAWSCVLDDIDPDPTQGWLTLYGS